MHLSAQVESAMTHHAGHNDVVVAVVFEVVVGVDNVVVSGTVCNAKR